MANIWSNIIQCILLPLLLNIHIFCTRCGRQLHPCHPLLYFEEGKPQLLNDILWNIPGSLKHTLKNQKRYQIKCMLIRPRKVREMLGRKGPRVKCAKVWVGNWSLGNMVSCGLIWSGLMWFRNIYFFIILDLMSPLIIWTWRACMPAYIILYSDLDFWHWRAEQTGPRKNLWSSRT